jgi:hypothetical protein
MVEQNHTYSFAVYFVGPKKSRSTVSTESRSHTVSLLICFAECYVRIWYVMHFKWQLEWTEQDATHTSHTPSYKPIQFRSKLPFRNRLACTWQRLAVDSHTDCRCQVSRSSFDTRPLIWMRLVAFQRAHENLDFFKQKNCSVLRN